MSLPHRLISSLPRPLAERFAQFLRRSPLFKRLAARITSSFKDRDGVVAAGPARGLRFNIGQSDSRFLLGTFEPAVQEILLQSLRSGMTFYDVGAIYVSGHSVDGVAHALGVGLRGDVAWFSFIERTELRLDVAKTVNAASPWQFWVGVQHAF